MTPASKTPPIAVATNPIAEFAGAYPRRSAKGLAALLAAVLLWHLTLPSLFYRSSAVFIEGPLPAILGAAVALWLHRDDRPAAQALAACGWAFVVGVVVLLLLGLPLFGVVATLGSLVTLARNAVRIPFADVIGSSYAPWLLWMGIKTVLAWGTVAYAVILYRRHGAEGLRGLLTGWGEQRAFSASQHDQWRRYRRLYVEAVRAGAPLPAAPASLVAPGIGRGRGGFDWARGTYWLVRIGVALTGAGGLYALLSQDIRSQLAGLLFRGWFL